MGLRTMLGLKRRKAPKKAREPLVRPPVNALLWQRATERSADFIEAHLGTAMLMNDTKALHRFVLDDLPREGMLLEFGVFKGQSINGFADDLAERGDGRTIHGFDAFQGLQEHWLGVGYHRDRVHFNQGGRLPEVRGNVRLVPGWIDDTLPPFLAANPGPIAFLHVDTDTYLPAKTVLSLCKGRLAAGSVVLFDELLAYPGWQDGEFRALQEELDPASYRWIAFSGWRAALRMLTGPDERGGPGLA